MILKSLSIIYFSLTVVLVVTLISFIAVIILNKRALRPNGIAVYLAKQLINRLNGSFDIQYSPEGEVVYYMKLPLSKDVNDEPADCITIHRPIKKDIEFDYTHESELTDDKKVKMDPEFIDRVTSLIFREITNTDNIIEVISSELCISSSQLNRRIKLMTGMTTTNFILKTRLNRAKKQLTITQKQIGEVAMDCGFNDFAYFSRSFKKEFEMTPSAFQRITNSLN
jgi:AraC-like DNA-binding protein